MRLLRTIGTALAIMSLNADAQTREERLLGWVESADPVRMLADSSRAGRVHFLTVCGIACFEPEIGFLTYTHCYSRIAKTHTVDPTGDVIVSARHGELKQKAFAFAREYNRLLRKELDRTGRRHCPATEEWDAYWMALDSLARRIPAHPYESFVTASGPRGRTDFQLHIQDQRDRSDAIYERACALAPRHGIVGTVTFAVTSGDVNVLPKRHPGFTCRNGKRI